MITNLAVKSQKIKNFNFKRNNLKAIGQLNVKEKRQDNKHESQQSQQYSEFVYFDINNVKSAAQLQDEGRNLRHTQSFTHFKSSSNVGRPCLSNLKNLNQERNRKKLLKMISSPKQQSQAQKIRSQMFENIKFLQKHCNKTLRKQNSKDLNRSSVKSMKRSTLSVNYSIADKSRRTKISLVSASINNQSRQRFPTQHLQLSKRSLRPIELASSFNITKNSKISVCQYVKNGSSTSINARGQQNSFDIIALSYQQSKQNLKKKKKGIQLSSNMISLPGNNRKHQPNQNLLFR